MCPCKKNQLKEKELLPLLSSWRWLVRITDNVALHLLIASCTNTLLLCHQVHSRSLAVDHFSYCLIDSKGVAATCTWSTLNSSRPCCLTVWYLVAQVWTPGSLAQWISVALLLLYSKETFMGWRAAFHDQFNFGLPSSPQMFFTGLQQGWTKMQFTVRIQR